MQIDLEIPLRQTQNFFYEIWKNVSSFHQSLKALLWHESSSSRRANLELYLRVHRENPKTEEGRQKITTLFNGAANDDDHDDEDDEEKK